jgi:predicted DNA-binding protein (MmcQ/YjbR family)
MNPQNERQESKSLIRVRKFCMALTDTTEAETLGQPTFRVMGKTYCVFEEYKGEKAVAVKVGLPVQRELLKDERFYKTPHLGPQGWVSLRLGGRFEWSEAEDLIRGSYKLMARRSSAQGRSISRR